MQDKGFVLVLGDDTLKQQVADLKEQLRVLQIAVSTFFLPRLYIWKSQLELHHYFA